MAIKAGHGSRSASSHGKLEMNLEEFKAWLQRHFDADKDGRISQEELREAIRARGGWFTRWKGKKALKSADKDGNGFIDEDEIDHLKDFALKHLGVRIV